MEYLADTGLVLLLILLNGVFSMSETAVVSSRRARLQALAEGGAPGARIALGLAQEPNRFLSTIQIAITLIGILAGAFGGATVAEGLSGGLAQVPALAPYSQALGLGVVVLVTTYLSLVIGELVPKRLALNAPERVASGMARPMHLLSLLAGPLVKTLSASVEFVLWLLHVRPSAEPPVSEEEIKQMLDEGTQVGVFEASEQDMVKRVFRLNDMRVNMLMTPRTEVVWLDVADSVEEVQHKLAESGLSRFPVCQDSPDKVLGIVRVKDLLAQQLSGQPFSLRAALREPFYVPESIPVMAVLEEFKHSGAHLALVVDEYGGLSGLFTVNNILTAIVGDIPQAGRPSEPMAVQRENGSWLLDGMLSIVEFKELFKLSTSLPDEHSGTYQTLAGLIMRTLGRIPSVADSFEWNGMRFEVVDMDGNKIDRVLVEAVPPAGTQAGAGAQP